jgi:hypothetical protein
MKGRQPMLPPLRFHNVRKNMRLLPKAVRKRSREGLHHIHGNGKSKTSNHRVGKGAHKKIYNALFIILTLMDLGHRGSQKIRNLPPCLSNGTGSAETAFSGFLAAV